jgi:hypothetical protein
VKPFFTEANQGLFSSTVIRQVEAIPFYYVAQYKPVLTSNWSPTYAGVSDENVLFSPISKEYVERLRTLCDAKGVVFQIMAPPINVAFQAKLKAAQSQFEVLPGYVETWRFYASNNFIADQIHLNRFDFLHGSPWQQAGLIR